MIRIEPGWNFNSADFSVQANGNLAAAHAKPIPITGAL